MKRIGMTFGEALEVMKQGYKVRRQSQLITECWLTVRNGNICDDTGTTYSDIQSENILANDWEIYNKSQNEPQFEIGELVMVRSHQTKIWNPKFFSFFEDGLYYGIDDDVLGYPFCAKFDKDIVFTDKPVKK